MDLHFDRGGFASDRGDSVGLDSAETRALLLRLGGPTCPTSLHIAGLTDGTLRPFGQQHGFPSSLKHGSDAPEAPLPAMLCRNRGVSGLLSASGPTFGLTSLHTTCSTDGTVSSSFDQRRSLRPRGAWILYFQTRRRGPFMRLQGFHGQPRGLRKTTLRQDSNAVAGRHALQCYCPGELNVDVADVLGCARRQKSARSLEL
ncbi:hypothetical protein DFH06DRAFT_1151815 [Mycena polygramma]|nr:hypothetical protein DFH06DRAFT_1151815 [Mycena polygramma]